MPRAEGVGEARGDAERVGLGVAEVLGVAVAVGTLQRPPVKRAPALHAALLALKKQAPLRALCGASSAPELPMSAVENTASPMQAAAPAPTHCSRAALQLVPPRHRTAAAGPPGMKEALARGEGLAMALGDAAAEGLGVAEAVGGLQRPCTHAMPLPHPAGAERGAHCSPTAPPTTAAPTPHWARARPWQASSSGLHAVPGAHRTAATGVLVQFAGKGGRALSAGQARAASHAVQAGAGPMLRSAAVP